MKIPKKIKICGHWFDIKQIKDRDMKDGGGPPASSYSRNNRIWIDLRQAPSRIESCLIHEIIEMLNYDYQWNLEHKTISQIESGIYQVLKDNKLLK